MKHALSLFTVCLLCCNLIAAHTVSVPAAVTDGQACYTLYSAPVALDFSTTDGLEAYVCTRTQLGILLDRQTVTLTRVTAVPANTGLLLRAAAAGDYSVAEAPADTRAPRRNYLVAVAERTDAADIFQDDGYDSYSPATLTLSADGQAGFAVVPLAHDYKKNDQGVYANVYHRGEQFLEAGTAYLGVTDMMGSGAVASLNLLQEPEPVPTADGIGAAKTLCDRATDDSELLLTLSGAVVTYATPGGEASDELVIIEEASGALRLRHSGMGAQLKAGDRLSGTLSLAIDYTDYGSEIIADETTLMTDLTVTPGDAPQPLVITDDNIEDYIFDFDWRLVRFNDVKYVAGEEPELDIEMMGDRIKLFDICGAGIPLMPDGSPIASGTRLDAVGCLFALLGSNYFQPFQFVIGGTPTALPPVAQSPSSGDTFFDLQGRRVHAPGPGLYISAGKKLLLKR